MALQKELEEKNDAIDSKRKCVGLRDIPHGIESGRGLAALHKHPAAPAGWLIHSVIYEIYSAIYVIYSLIYVMYSLISTPRENAITL
jgi:hypothetical protein